jgi:outer membrane receptor protein involved in Fe transport
MRFAASGKLYYGSGFSDGSSPVPAHLPGHTTFDLAVSRSFSERVTLSVTVLNLANRRFLIDNSQTFNGTHYARSETGLAQVRYRFHL